MSVELDVVDPDAVWVRSAMVRLPGADRDAVSQELGSAIHEFVRKSNCLVVRYEIPLEADVAQYSLSPIPTIANEGQADFAGLDGTFLHYVDIPGFELRLYPRDYDPSRLLWNVTSSHHPLACWCPTPSKVALFPAPAASLAGQNMEVCVSASLRRRYDTASPDVPMFPTVPTFLAQHYFDPILDGVTGRMMSHAKRPYSDPRLGVYYLKRFRDGMRVATDEALRKWSSSESSFMFNRDWSANSSGRRVR